jgi:hypothetical protein
MAATSIVPVAADPASLPVRWSAKERVIANV